MQHRVRAAGLMLDPEQRILLVREIDASTGGKFWVPPGGGLEPQDTSIIDCLRREIREETGLSVATVGRLVYLREFSEISRTVHHVELFFEVCDYHGVLSSGCAADAEEPNLFSRPAKWFHRTELLNLRAYPRELKQEFWNDRASATHHCRHLGVELESSNSP